MNILKNAAEHTPAGGEIQMAGKRNPLHTALVISDTGPGICREDLPHLFERFYKGKNAGPDSVGTVSYTHLVKRSASWIGRTKAMEEETSSICGGVSPA